MAVSAQQEKPQGVSQRAQEDLRLVQAALNGDQSAYAQLMARYRDAIYFLVLKMVHDPDDANDLTIEAFAKAFSNLPKYLPEFAFSTWLYRIALNNCIDFIRKNRLECVSIFQEENPDRESASELELPSPQPDPEEHYVRMQRNKLLREVIERLSPKYRKLIELRFFEELSYEEIAERTNLPLGTVKAQLFRAKNLLYQILKPRLDKL
ncbi:MAG: sigma-70 family RNA polymerase sigma factor [Chitinophagales bacterium]|nr:sigma-70 family RNA polymerase sigma factor [Chitinophagales bacterium]MDW8428483.1 sigma-70 family RNA polymerase sigma factor [Chitinophagales bacterium]